MIQILIPDLQSQDLKSLPFKSGNNDLISDAINRALDARKILGGGRNLGSDILPEPTHVGPLPGPEFG
jgi:hypothetical protein